MTLKIATWNINSVRLRIASVERFLSKTQPDILCLQETKCPQGQFPSAPLRELGYSYIAENGQKGYHGVATVSRIPFKNSFSAEFGGVSECRHVAVELQASVPVRIHNFYVPAGGDEADPGANEKFAHKLRFIGDMERWSGTESHTSSEYAVLVGDLNIAPLEQDVWSHKDLLKVVSHTPVETEGLTRVQQKGAWSDVMRLAIPPEEKLYTWWSYRARDWQESNRGRRLDHVWASELLSRHFRSLEVLKEARGWQQPSDHVPVTAEFDL
jgi:exodeoxyribonuclease-3